MRSRQRIISRQVSSLEESTPSSHWVGRMLSANSQIPREKHPFQMTPFLFEDVCAIIRLEWAVPDVVAAVLIGVWGRVCDHNDCSNVVPDSVVNALELRFRRVVQACDPS